MQIRGYSPCNYGLYHTTVGYDVIGGDMFENVKTYAVRHAEEDAKIDETEPIPETDPVETEPAETDPDKTETTDTPLETDPSESSPSETDDPSDEPPVSDQNKNIFAYILIGLTCVVFVFAIFIYVVSIRNYNQRSRRRRRY